MGGLNQKIFLTFLVLLFLSAPSSLQASEYSQPAYFKLFVEGNTFTGKVVGISDGDTISVMRGGRAVEVRLHGIDCPENKQPYGTRAKQFTSDMASGKEVTVRIQPMDRYGRTVGTVGVVILQGGKNLNWELVDAGLAWWYRKYAPDDRMLERLETEARAAKRGLWADKNPIPLWEWRKMQYGAQKR
jgi:endonuclease YncB( thermonuclease family)